LLEVNEQLFRTLDVLSQVVRDSECKEGKARGAAVIEVKKGAIAGDTR